MIMLLQIGMMMRSGITSCHQILKRPSIALVDRDKLTNGRYCLGRVSQLLPLPFLTFSKVAAKKFQPSCFQLISWNFLAANSCGEGGAGKGEERSCLTLSGQYLEKADYWSLYGNFVNRNKLNIFHATWKLSWNT